MEVVASIYPYTSWAVPWLHTAFETAAANASGIDAALKIMRKKGKIKQEHVDVIAFAGDGGTYDIGLQALSGAVERGHDFLFVLYDNEGYMNTGIQRSGGTPIGAATTTSPAGKVRPASSSGRNQYRHYGCPRHTLRCNGGAVLLEGLAHESPEGPRSGRTRVPARYGSLPQRMAKRTRQVNRVLDAGCRNLRFSTMRGRKRQNELSTPSKLIHWHRRRRNQSQSTSRDKDGSDTCSHRRTSMS